jgi:hypothetical protein
LFDGEFSSILSALHHSRVLGDRVLLGDNDGSISVESFKLGFVLLVSGDAIEYVFFYPIAYEPDRRTILWKPVVYVNFATFDFALDVRSGKNPTPLFGNPSSAFYSPFGETSISMGNFPPKGGVPSHLPASSLGLYSSADATVLSGRRNQFNPGAAAWLSAIT